VVHCHSPFLWEALPLLVAVLVEQKQRTEHHPRLQQNSQA